MTRFLDAHQAMLGGAMIAVAAAVAVGSPPVAPTEALSPAEQRAKFRVAAGYEIQLVAAEPDIQKPMNMAFDGRGRLWVTHSVEYPFAAPEGRPARDGITILDDFGPDGRARKATRFAADLNIPIGVLPLPDCRSAIVWSIPNIWKLTDSDGDGRCDDREILYGPFDFADTHGDQNAFRLGPDGWVYACHGFRNDSKVRLRGRGDVVLALKSGNTYRFRPDGSAIEQVTQGQVNPFGMCFDALGNQFTADCHSRPVTMLLRGGCYESFGRPHDGLGYAPEMTGHDHGSTGIAGAVVYDDPTGFPADMQGSLFVGNVITNTVHRDRVAWRGSSPWVEAPEDFLVCDDWWFRPADIQLGPDGGLYVADFYNCIIGHYEVDLRHPRRDRERGRIWRVVARERAAAVPTDIAALDRAALVAALDHPNLTVRRLAREQLAARGPAEAARDGLRILADHAASARMQSLAVWLAAATGDLDAEAGAVARHSAREVRVNLVKALDGAGAWTPARADIVRGLLADSDPFVRRAAAEAVGGHRDTAALEPLLRAWGAAATEDVQLGHALRIAVRDLLRPGAGVAAIDIAALELDPADRRRLLEVATAVPDDDTAWAAFCMARDGAAGPGVLARALAGVAQHCGAERVDAAVRSATAETSGGLSTRLWAAAVEGTTRAGRRIVAGSALAEWSLRMVRELLLPRASTDAAALRTALVAVEQLRAIELFEAVAAVVADRSLPTDCRVAGAATLGKLDADRAVAVLGDLARDGAAPAAVRQAAFRELGVRDLAAARDVLTVCLATAPAALRQPAAMALAEHRAGAERLLELVAAGKVDAAVLQAGPVAMRLQNSGIPDIDGRLADLTRDLPSPDKAVQDRIRRLASGYAGSHADAVRGAELFRKVCAGCHRLGGVGGAVGPQLDGIGHRGLDRLLEDVLDPGRNVDEAFRVTVVTTTDGLVVAGLKLREEGRDLVLADATGQEVRVAGDDIDEVTVMRASPMPGNVAEQVGEENVPHLLAFLLGQRTADTPAP